MKRKLIGNINKLIAFTSLAALIFLGGAICVYASEGDNGNECVGDSCKFEFITDEPEADAAPSSDAALSPSGLSDAAITPAPEVNNDKKVKKNAPLTGEFDEEVLAEAVEDSEETSSASAYAEDELFEETAPSDYRSNPSDFTGYNIACQDVRGSMYGKVLNGKCGKPIILNFGGVGSCTYCARNMGNLKMILDENPGIADAFYFDVKANTRQTMLDEIEREGWGNELCVERLAVDKYRSSRSVYENELIDLLLQSQIIGLDQDSYTMPLTIYIDSNGKFVTSTTGSVSKYQMEELIRQCIKEKAPDRAQTEAFVSRLYTIILARDAEAEGLNSWTNDLMNKTKNGADVAEGFVLSTELNNKNISDEEFVERMYLTFLGRASDAGGKSDWVKKLRQGYSRRFVAAGFVNSQEFTNICNQYGITRGTLTADDTRSDENLHVDEDKVNDYVESLYRNILGRAADPAGKSDWVNRIKTHKMSAAEVARIGFFTSTEYLNKNKTNEQFLTDLYAAFFNRQPDAAGFNGWLSRMSQGYTRDQVILEGFGQSQEFNNLLRSYGLKCEE